jgi:Family of unknown function (DUF6069)
VDAGKLWAGGAATALVAGLVGLIGVLISDAVLDIDPVVPGWLLGDGGRWTVAGRFALTAAVAAVVATLLLHLLLLSTPGPRAFFGWIIALATVGAAAVPFASNGDLSEQIATSVITLCIGLAIGNLLLSVATRAMTYPPSPR